VRVTYKKTREIHRKKRDPQTKEREGRKVEQIKGNSNLVFVWEKIYKISPEK
jgi:hypothetical protein